MRQGLCVHMGGFQNWVKLKFCLHSFSYSRGIKNNGVILLHKVRRRWGEEGLLSSWTGYTMGFERQVRQEDGEKERGGIRRSSGFLSHAGVRAQPLLHHLGLPSGTWQQAWLISIFTAKGQLTGCSMQTFKLLD